MHTLKRFFPLFQIVAPWMSKALLGFIFVLVSIPTTHAQPTFAETFPDDNNSPGTALDISIPALVLGAASTIDTDWWNIPDGTAITLEVVSIETVNSIVFNGVSLELVEFSSSARTTEIASQALVAGSEVTLSATGFYSLRIIGLTDFADLTPFPPAIDTYGELRDAIDDLADQLNAYADDNEDSLPDELETLIGNFESFLNNEVQDYISDAETNGIPFPADPAAFVELFFAGLTPDQLAVLVDVYSVALVIGAPGGGGVAPVTWNHFEVAEADAAVKLTWSTASEENNQGFAIERSPDAVSWELLSFVPGAGTTHMQQAYTYWDTDPLLGLNYYRLKQSDFNGDYAYSDIRDIHLGKQVGSVYSVFPNPVESWVSVKGLVGDLQLIDLQGKVVWQGKLEGNVDRLQLFSLVPGIYTWKLQPANSRLQIARFLKK